MPRFCHEALSGRLVVATCPTCATRHHAACLVEAERCAVHGCSGRLAASAPAAATA